MTNCIFAMSPDLLTYLAFLHAKLKSSNFLIRIPELHYQSPYRCLVAYTNCQKSAGLRPRPVTISHYWRDN